MCLSLDLNRTKCICLFLRSRASILEDLDLQPLHQPMYLGVIKTWNFHKVKFLNLSLNFKSFFLEAEFSESVSIISPTVLIFFLRFIPQVMNEGIKFLTETSRKKQFVWNAEISQKLKFYYWLIHYLYYSSWTFWSYFVFISDNFNK